MERRIETLMNELRAGLEEIYGPRLKGVYVFGSYARGEQEAESDVDVLVVLDDFEDYGEEVDRVSSLASELSLSHDLSVSEVFVRERDWLHGDTPFLWNVREEAVLA